MILNYTKTFQVIFKSQNKQIVDPEQYQIKLGNQVLETKNSTKFLSIHLDESIIFKTHILEVCRKLNYILFLMRSVRPYFDIPTMINLYYTFFYPHSIYGIEFYGHAANCHLNQIYLLQKSALRVILKIRPLVMWPLSSLSIKLCPSKCFLNTAICYILIILALMGS